MEGERIRSEWPDLERPLGPGPTVAGAAVLRSRPFDAVAASPVPVVVIDSDTTVRIWNPAAERLFGCSREEVAGGSIPIVPFAQRDELRAARTRGIDAIVATLDDRPERHRIEAAAHKMIQTIETSWDRAPIVASELDAGQLLQTITDACTLLSGAQLGAASFKIVDDEGGSYLLYACAGAGSAARGASAIPPKRNGFTPTVASDAMDRLGWPTRERWDGRDSPTQAATLEHLPVGRYLAVPMIGRSGDVRGGLFLAYLDADVFTRESKRVVLALAAYAAIAIDSARLYEAERRARNAADAANRAKEEFLAVLGHELRNPLATVRNGIATARLDSARRDHVLELADHGAEQLSRLTDDLRDVAGATQGKIMLRRVTVGLAAIIERAVASARYLIEARGHAITVSLGGDLRVDGDPFRLEQVIGNILSNAAKYTNPGGHIVVTLAQEHDDAVVRVRDTGMGIAPEMLPRIFGLFVQAEQSLDRAQGGLGIGLALVKHLVELHGGRVEAYSDGCGRGAELVVRLPIVGPAGNAVPQGTVGSRGDHACARVLVVEDDAEAAELTTILLEGLGHRVRTALDGPSALQAALADPPDVMLVDIGLPGMDGYEIAQSVRRHEDLRHVSLVALTGYGRDEDRQHAFAAGFDHHLEKPVNIDDLLGLVARPAAPQPPHKLPL